MRDEELAAVLLASDRPALVTVWCVHQQHVLAKVYSGVPGKEGPLLAVRGWGARSEDWHGREYVGGQVWQPTTVMPIDGPEKGASAARCRHGSAVVARAALQSAIATARATGEPQDMVADRSFSPD